MSLSRFKYAAALAGALLLVALGLPRCGQDAKVPPELLGVWHTLGPDYADRPFEIRNHVVVFQQGPQLFDFAVYTIAGIKAVAEKETTLYIITYEDEHGQDYEFSFYYEPGQNGGVIRFRHQPKMLWRKAKKAKTEPAREGR